jgi:hypothetical protein
MEEEEDQDHQDVDPVQERDIEGHNRQMIQVPIPMIQIQKIQ